MKKGFTLIEVLVVASMIGILVMIMLPSHQTAVKKAKEAVLKENLFQIRDAIAKYYADKGKYPADLEELVTAKYLRKVPEDPIAKKAEWQPVYFEPEEGEDFDPTIMEGIIDIKSLSAESSVDGTAYNEW